MKEESKQKGKIIKYWDILTISILLFSGLWIYFTSTQSSSVGSQYLRAPQVGFLAPDVSVATDSGDEVTLSSFRGHPILLNVWASWCPPCRAEMPAMEKVYQEYKDQGFLVLAVNSTIQDSPEDAKAFYTELGLSFDLLYDYHGYATQAYQVRSLPTSYFISPDGIIREIVIGGPMAEALLVTRVEKLINGDY